MAGTKFGQHSRRGFLDVLALRNVAANGDRAATHLRDRLRRFLATLLVVVQEGDSGALSRECLRGSASHAAAGARDHGHAVL